MILAVQEIDGHMLTEDLNLHHDHEEGKPNFSNDAQTHCLTISNKL